MKNHISKEITRLEIQNGSPNFGLGGYFSCKLISGTINVNDLLVLPNDVKVPIATISRTKIDIEFGLYGITIPPEFDKSYVWHKLFGTIVEVEKRFQ